jgi:hypothetical protein
MCPRFCRIKIGPVMGSGEHGKKSSGYVKDEEFLN